MILSRIPPFGQHVGGEEFDGARAFFGTADRVEPIAFVVGVDGGLLATSIGRDVEPFLG